MCVCVCNEKSNQIYFGRCKKILASGKISLRGATIILASGNFFRGGATIILASWKIILGGAKIILASGAKIILASGKITYKAYFWFLSKCF